MSTVQSTTTSGLHDWRIATLQGIRHVLGANQCCWTTKKGTRCGSLMRRSSIDEARSIVTALEHQPFDLSALRPIFNSISPLVLCKRWHKTHADSLSDFWFESASKAHRWYQELGETARDVGAADLQRGPVADTANHSDEMPFLQPGSRYLECQSITIGDLRQLRNSWGLEPNGHPVSLRRASDARSRCLLLSFKLASERNHSENCPICLNELQHHPEEHPEDAIHVQCDRCHRSSHLGCIGDWLASDTFTDMHCPFWYKTPRYPPRESLGHQTNNFDSRTSKIFHAIAYVPRIEVSPSPEQAQSRSSSSRVGGPTALPSPRRSVRERRAPDRYTPQ
ncbi:uncharacterized protein N7469_001983 [Penicillium citrinum]|uniref:RING-type domain-containing protein n=1 Tax=Penicillium citrinum TaxID=5077 RepID=A0A9W9P9N3_PENCI|nr:uncharacterized protein N7469_001983 [Penicillium citrinum]KAJ5240392.1 hypothetical protein N7469_001983 [Penicillium citrinum]